MPRISEVNINTVEYWDGIYGRGEFPTGDSNNYARYTTAAAFQLGNSALDIGCGQAGVGKALGIAYQGRIQYIGVDHSQAAIDTTMCAAGSYLCMDWRDITIQADTVYVLELIEHVNNPVALLAKAASLARRRLVIGTPRYEAIPYPLHRGEHQWDFTTDELRALFAPYGEVVPIVPAGAQCCIAAVNR